jgi:hypothetical protein
VSTIFSGLSSTPKLKYPNPRVSEISELLAIFVIIEDIVDEISSVS